MKKSPVVETAFHYGASKMKNDSLKFKIIFTIIFFGGILFLPKISLAADHYVRQGASGLNDGSDWTNAWTNLPSALVRGDTYYIADGNYPNYTFDDPVSGTKYIIVKKAVLSDHGTETGWQNEYGNGQAIWNSWSISQSYYIFNGVNGSDNNSSSYGFKLTPASCNFSGTNILVQFGTVSNLSNIEFRHIDFRGCGKTEPNCSYAIKSNSYQGDSRGLVIADNLFFGHAVQVVMYHWDNAVLERNFFDTNWSASVCHGEQVTFGGDSDDIVYRYNIHKNSATGGLAVHHNDNDRWKVYGNIFYGGEVAMGVIGTADSGPTHPDVIKNWEVYNNTIFNVIGSGNGSGFWQGECTNSIYSSRVYNNLFVNTRHPVFHSTNQSCVDHNYNSFYGVTWLGSGSEPQETNKFVGSGNPLINALNNDFRLAQATTPGLALISEFNADFSGATRGSDGVWDRGAYEYTEAPSPDTTPPASPTGVQVQ